MTVRKYSSTSQETNLTSALSSGASTMLVNSASALLGGITLAAGETFTVVIDPDTALEEIVDVIFPSASGSNTVTITRGTGVDGTNAIAHSAGAKVRHMAIGRDFREANNHIEGTLASHAATTSTQLRGVISDETGTGSLVFGTSPTIASPTITGTGAIAGTFTGNLTGNVTGTISGNAGTVTNGVYTTDTGTVTSTMIANGTILDADINAAAAIAKTKISGTAITAADTGTVTSTMILDGTILNADINSAAAIAYSKLNLAGSITSADITDLTIVNGDISATAAIAYGKLNLNGTITSADIVDGTIVNADINAAAAIALSKLATDPLARANHTGTQTASTISNFDTQVRTSKVTDLASPTTAFSMNSQKITSLADPTVAQDASTKAYVDAQVNALVNGAPGTLDTLGEIATAIGVGGSFTNSVVLKTGSTMTGDLVLNANPTVNLGAATKQYVDAVAGSATAAAASATAAATSYDSFDDRYLGPKAVAPTLDNDGNALLVGALYWDTAINAMLVWSGTTWGGISSTAAIFRYRYVATAGQTSVSGLDANGITLSYLPGKEQVYLNGVLLVRTSDYTGSTGSSITALAAMAAGDVLEIITFTAFDVATSIANTIFDAKGDILVGIANDTPGKVPVGTNGFYLQANSATATGLEWTAVTGYNAPTLGSTSIASGATVTTIAGLTLTAPTLTGTVTASGDVTLSAAGAFGSLKDYQTLSLMGAL